MSNPPCYPMTITAIAAHSCSAVFVYIKGVVALRGQPDRDVTFPHLADTRHPFQAVRRSSGWASSSVLTGAQNSLARLNAAVE